MDSNIFILIIFCLSVRLCNCHSANHLDQDFPGGQVDKLSSSNAGGTGLISGWEAKIPDVLWPKDGNIKQKQYHNEFKKDFKNGPH